MRKFQTFLAILLMASAAAAQTQSERAAAAPLPAPFTYQGKLTVNSVLAQGAFDLKIYLCATDDPEREPTEACMDVRELSGVDVRYGIFTVRLDFPQNYFTDFEELFLEIHVRRTESGDDFTKLLPRQQIDASPFSISAKALTCGSCITDGHIISVSGSKVTGKVPSAANADNAANAANAQNAQNAVFAATAQNAVNAVDLTNNQTVSGNKTFLGILSGNGSGLTGVPGTLKWNVATGGNIQMQSNNGYVLTNTAAATVTLPASPAVGDVVRVIAKGTGGFTVAMNQGQSILDWATTHQETSWTRQYSVRGTTTLGGLAVWSAVASSTDGTKLVAVQYPGILATSTNGGQSWSEKINDEDRFWTSVASSADGTKLIASVEGGHLFTSTDSGDHWTERFADMDRSWYSVASSADGTKLVAADNRNVYVSADSGVSWSNRMSPNTISRVASSADGTKLIAAVMNGHVYTSTDSGLLWFDRLSSSFNQWQAVASSSNGSKLVAVESPGRVWISSNSGGTWTSAVLGPSGTNTSWSGVSMSSDGMRVAVSAGGSVGGGGAVGLLAISYNGGTSWTPTGIGTVWGAVAMAGNGTRMSATTIDNSQNLLYSGPIQTITVVDTLTGIKDSAVELVYIGNDQFAMVSSNGMTIPPHTY